MFLIETSNRNFLSLLRTKSAPLASVLAQIPVKLGAFIWLTLLHLARETCFLCYVIKLNHFGEFQNQASFVTNQVLICLKTPPLKSVEFKSWPLS